MGPQPGRDSKSASAGVDAGKTEPWGSHRHEPQAGIWVARPTAASRRCATPGAAEILHPLALDATAPTQRVDGCAHADRGPAGRVASSENVLRDAALWLRPTAWPLLPVASRRRTLLLAWTAILAQVVFLGGWLLAGALEPRYSAIRQYISELGREGAANPWIFVVFMAVWGLGWIALAVGVVPSLRTRPWPLAMPSMFALAGVCGILVGPLRMDCSPILSAACKSREAAVGRSWHYEAHVWLSLGIKVALLASGFAFARSAWPSRLGRLVLGGALVLLVAGVITFALHDSFGGYEGLEERLWACVAQAWAVVCATVLILEATLTPDRLRSHEVSMQRRGPAEPAVVGVERA